MELYDDVHDCTMDLGVEDGEVINEAHAAVSGHDGSVVGGGYEGGRESRLASGEDGCCGGDTGMKDVIWCCGRGD